MSAHTPGPWHVDKLLSIYAGEAPDYVFVALPLKAASPEERAANARLIAAAPAMYAALVKAEVLAWAAGSRVFHGAVSLHPDDRGELWLEIAHAIALANQQGVIRL